MDLTNIDTQTLLAELDRRVRAAAPPKVWFFGVWPGERAGHFVRDKNGTMIRWPDENTLYPWRYWDYSTHAARVAGAAPQDEGRMWHRYVDGRTVLVSWDRSADRRGGCAASFIVDSLVPPEHALTIARSTFPRVFDRIETHLGRAVVLAGPALASEPDPFDAADFFGVEGQDDLDESPAEAILRGVAQENEPGNVLELRAFVDEVAPIRVLAYVRRDPTKLLADLTNYVNDEWWDEMEHDGAAEMSGKDPAKSEAKIAELLAQFAAFMGEPTRCNEVASRTYGSEELFDLLLAHYAGEFDEESET